MISFIFALLFVSANAGTLHSCVTNFDQIGIPRVEIKSEEEYYFCFGLHHGKDRAWQMDYFRRAGQGRNAEIYGFVQLKSDLLMRFLDLPKLADKLWNEFTPEKKKLLENYAFGVNEGLKTGKNALEFQHNGFTPEAWKPQDSLLVMLLQSFDQTRRTFMRDYDEQVLKEEWEDKTDFLFNDESLPWENTILKEGEYKKQKGKSLKTTSSIHSPINLWADFPEIFGKETGSNNWVISKRKSKTGHAFLANDPHLDLKTPLFWYWISFKGQNMNLIGASVPGVPVIVSGTNGEVAWGLTNSYINSADVGFLKDVKEEDIQSVRPTVHVKFGFLKLPFMFKSFDKLKDGTLILPLELGSSQRIYLRWTGFGLIAKDFYSMFDIHEARNVTDMNNILIDIGIPSWNFVFADTEGEIGYRLVGKTFKHSKRTPFGISLFIKKSFASGELLSSDERPHLLKPKRDYIYTANNRHWPFDAEFYGGRGYSQSFRGFRIDELLKDGKKDLENLKAIQCDTQVVDARFFIPKLQDYLNVPEFEKWDYSSSDSSRVLPVYRRLMDTLLKEWSVNENALYKLLDNLSSDRVEELRDYYDEAVSDSGNKTWGEIHRVNFPHLSKNTDWVFSPEIAGVGDTHSVNPGTADWMSGVYKQTSGASMRMIIEMTKVPKIYLGLPGLNRNYTDKSSTDPWKSWKNCEYSQIEF